MSAPYDAIVIGAGVNGLTAATYLARAGRRVLVLEAQEHPGGLARAVKFGDGFSSSRGAHLLYALDPRVIRELKLVRHGLKFAARGLPLVGLRNDGRHLVIARDGEASARSIAIHSSADAEAWPSFRQEWFAFARELRALWWQAGTGDAGQVNGRVERLARTGTTAWLDSWFESDAVKATLGFDAKAMPPSAAGSALLLHWRAAQEMSGMQGATALPLGGVPAVVDALATASRKAGAELRTKAMVADILVDAQGAASGVVLDSGEAVTARFVLSSLSRQRTLSFAAARAVLGLGDATALDTAATGTRMAHVTLALDTDPAISGTAVPRSGRFVVLDRLESLAQAHVDAQAGRLPQELAIEVILPAAGDASLAPEGRFLLSALVGPLPVTPAGGWQATKPLLVAQVVTALGRFFAGLARHIVAVDILSPEDAAKEGAEDAFGGAVDSGRLLAGWRARLRTPVAGLVLCGAAADPVGAISGRGGRCAAAFVMEGNA